MTQAIQDNKFNQVHSGQSIIPHNPWYLFDLPMTEYEEAWKLQTGLVNARINKTIDTDIALFLEHPAVFTLGRRGGSDHLSAGGRSAIRRRVHAPAFVARCG